MRVREASTIPRGPAAAARESPRHETPRPPEPPTQAPAVLDDLPKIPRFPALVAFFWRVLIGTMPGMTNLPMYFASEVAMQVPLPSITMATLPKIPRFPALVACFWRV